MKNIIWKLNASPFNTKRVLHIRKPQCLVIIVAEFVFIADTKNKILIGLHRYLVSSRKCSITVLLHKVLHKICITIVLHNIIFLHNKQNYFEKFLGLQWFEIFLKKFVLSYMNIHTFSIVCVLNRIKNNNMDDEINCRPTIVIQPFYS